MEIDCAKPYLTAYDFMHGLCAALVLKNKKLIPIDDIVNKIYNYRINHKDKSKFFSDIEFRKGLNSVVSNDIMESIGELQTFGVVGKENPKYVNMDIKLTKERAREVLNNYTNEIIELLEDIALIF